MKLNNLLSQRRN